MQFKQQICHGDGRRAVEIAGRFIAKQQLWFPDERSRNGASLLFAARSLGREVFEAVGQSDSLQQVPRTWFVGTCGRHESGYQHILKNGALRQQRVILKNEPDVLVAKPGACFSLRVAMFRTLSAGLYP